MIRETHLSRRDFIWNSAWALGGVAWAGAGAQLRIGVAGLKHSHVHQVIQVARKDPRVSLAALADDDEQNRKECERLFGLPVRYTNHRDLLDSEKLDALVICEEYGRRGEVAIAALKAGKHVFCDKPLCTRAAELKSIAALAAGNRREVHVDFSLRHYWANAAHLIRQGEIGEIMSCTFAGPHALNYERRPRWYFRRGKHGGVINDLMGHGVDFAHWIVRRRYAEVLSATRACVGLPQHPDFETFGDAYFRMEGGASAFGRVDYLAPAGHPGGWTCFVVGSRGDAALSGQDGLCLRRAGAAERRLAASELRAESPHPFADWVRLLTEGVPPLRSTAESLHCSLAALLAQQAAETDAAHVPVPAFTEKGG
jgi:predicted dehydrogenase